ncbi:HTH-type transcriptional regulator CynR [Firmicutes bacterium ASF500]|nr:HTH-type transcriptional regulator CynR [Firmicutes bacterium ASF500]
MELRVLRYFLLAAREENITRAAELLHVTQPTLSRQLMQLEQELGTKLFHRGQHSITLTDDGMLLKRRAQELVDLADKTEREFVKAEGDLTGELSIGSGETLSMHTLSQWIASFQAENPLVQYDIYSATADEIKDRLEKGILDMGLLVEPVDITKYEFIRMPKKERWGILVSKSSPLALNDHIGPSDLAHTPLLIAKRNMVREGLRGWFGNSFDSLEIAGTYNLLYNAAVLAEHGVGAVLCMEHDRSYENLRFIPLFPVLETGAVLVWKKNQTCSAAASHFFAHVQKCSKRMDGDKI